MMPKHWYTGKELTLLWGVSDYKRKALIPHLKKRDMLRTRGATTTIKYSLRDKKDWLVVESIPKKFTGSIPTPTGNGVIDAKLREEAGLLRIPSALEELIIATEKIGTENEIFKQALNDIDAIITKVREYL